MEKEAMLDQANVAETEGKYLTFLTDAQLFGIPIAFVVQIVGIQEITPIPEFPHYAKGIINLRGEIIPVIDMRLRLGRMEAEYGERTCIIVINIRDRYIGLIVDEVDEVTEISEEKISLPPRVNNADGSYLTGVAKLEKRVALLLDTGKLLGEQDLSWIEQAEQLV